MKKVLWFAIIFVILPACSSLSKTPEATLAPTPIPLKNIDLSKLAFGQNDLPPGYSPSQIRINLSDISKGVSEPVNWFSQEIAKNGSMGGIIDIVVYNNQAEAKSAYDVMINTMINSDPSNPGIGDESLATSMFMSTVDVAFWRCKAAAHIQLFGTSNKDYAIAYMVQLDKRLKDIVCTE